MRSTTLAFLACTSLGCASAPPELVQTEYGRVLGHDRSEVERVASALDVAPFIRRTLGSSRTDLPEIWLLEEARTATGAYGTCSGDRISLARDAFALDPPETTRFFVAHEVARWYTESSPYAYLPHFIHEGLADYVTLEVLNWQGDRRTENEWIGEVRFDPSDLWIRGAGAWEALPVEYDSSLARIGYEVVSRLGLERLRELAARRTDAFGYLDAAGLTPRITLRRAPAASNRTHVELTWLDAAGQPVQKAIELDGVAGRASGKLPHRAEGWAVEFTPEAATATPDAHGADSQNAPTATSGDPDRHEPR